MLTWLAVWLQQIIAVVLLAGFIDLLLPNKAMQRYVRLVSGLIILLTILTPIINVLRGDFSARLDQQVEEWVKSDASKAIRMPTLEDIQDGAKALKSKQDASAAALAEQQLADAMKAGIEQSAGLHVEALQVKIVRDPNGQAARISKVLVKLASPDTEEEVDEDKKRSAGGDEEVKPVEDVQAVQVTVQPSDDNAPHADGEGRNREVIGARADAVRAVLREGWSVNPRSVEVVETPVDEAAAP